MLSAQATALLYQADLQALTVYGTADEVLNRGKYDTCRANLPADTVEVVIEGGCHAYFGSYGAQDGDGTPTITNEEQITQTADAIAALALPVSAGRGIKKAEPRHCQSNAGTLLVFHFA